MRNLAVIADAVKKSEKVSPEEFAYLLHNDKNAFLAFLVANNPGGVTNVLRNKLGYTFELNFKPDAKRLQRIIDMMIEKKDNEGLKAIAFGTPIQLAALSPDLVRAIKAYK